ncbi:MAG TPA: hypothetical protein VHX92_00580 [Rhizomicrobium sp.]|jgi:hypothetical protein|nr:hypothetical protein [Rhizomicrobium sp.]
MKPRTIAICGNGASAALLLIALARFSDRPVKIIVLGRAYLGGQDAGMRVNARSVE